MINDFITYLRDIKGYSAQTQISYEKDLRHFANWIVTYRPGKKWSTITRDDIDAYIIMQSRQGLKASTTNRRLSAISAIYKYFRRNGSDIEDPTKFESRRKLAKTIPNTIPLHDLHRAYTNAMGATKIMIGILASTGIRIQELLDIDYDDINYETYAIKIHGKGNKYRIVYADEETLKTLKTCKEDLQAKGKIFPIDQRTARYMIFTELRKVSSAKQLSPHAIRHTVATHYATMGANVTTIAQILGHDSIKTTQKYIDMSNPALSNTMQQYNILNN